MDGEISHEKPLSSAAKAGLMLGAGATILLFYLLAVLSILFLAVLVAWEFALLIVALRFGASASALVLQVLRPHASLLRLFLGSFYMRKKAEFRILLRREDAPGLFALLENLSARLEVAAPNEVSLEMSVNAWVRLKGLRRGAGKTILGIGYDLLAGLTQAEAEAVLAHEMVHAKLIQRGLKQWLASGMSRLARLTRALSAQVEAYRRVKRSFELAKFFLSGADWLTRLAARLIAKYSRQDEFEADRGAAELCGSAPIRSSLLKLDALARLAARLPWRERVAQLQLKSGFSQWLVRELALGESFQPSENSPALFDKYSTHPLLRDRLANLPPVTNQEPGNQNPAIQLLADPDKIAEKLVVEIQRVAARQELEDSKVLRRWTRKFRSRARVLPLQWVALGVCGTGVIISLDGIFGIRVQADVIVAGLLVLGMGVGLYRWGRYRDRVILPTPDYAELKKAWMLKKRPDIAALEKQIMSELRARLAPEKSARKKASLMVTEAYAALGKCDYLRAHVASRLCQEADKQTVEGRLALGIASAALHQGQQASWAMTAVQRATGMASPSVIWGAAWMWFLLGDWASAEAFLDQAVKLRPEVNTLRALHAISQSRRGKMQSAISSARAACTPQPPNIEYSKLLIGLLLDGGYLTEALERLLRLDSYARADSEIMFLMVRVKLMQHEIAAADEWTALLKEQGNPATKAQTLVRLGEAYEAARNAAAAAAFFEEALAAGHYPEAHLGLARREVGRKNKEQARKHLHAALNTQQPLGEGATGPLPLFHRIVQELLHLEEPRLNCRAWIARLGAEGAPPAVANQSFMIFAPELPEAARYLTLITSALDPARPPLAPSAIRWQEAPRQQQPDGPCRPGVQGVLA